jgi:hypothetical protein
MTYVAKGREYPVNLALEYRISEAAMSDPGVTGTGRTLVMSSGEVLFEADRALPTGLDVSLFIAWPASLSRTVGLTLRVSGRIVHASGHVAALTMVRHAFHTRALSEMWQQNQAKTAVAGQT